MTEEEVNNNNEPQNGDSQEEQGETQGESQEETNYNSYVFVDGEWKHVNLLLNSGFLSAGQLAVALADYYTASETDVLLGTKANSSTTYTKTETNTLLGAKADTLTTYTKTEVDTALSNKASTSDLSGKADVSTTYTKTQTDNAISTALSNFEFYEVVQSLPTQNIKTNRAYMVRNSNNSGSNLYDVYVYVNNAWEQWDSIELDVSNFASASTTYTKSEVNALLKASEITNDSSTVSGTNVDDALDNLKSIVDVTNSLLNNLNTYIIS